MMALVAAVPVGHMSSIFTSICMPSIARAVYFAFFSFRAGNFAFVYRAEPFARSRVMDVFVGGRNDDARSNHRLFVRIGLVLRANRLKEVAPGQLHRVPVHHLHNKLLRKLQFN